MNATPSIVSRRRARFTWLWIGLAVAAVIAGLALAVRATITPERAHAYALKALNTALRREVRFTRADLTYWPPVSISVDGLQVSDPQGFAQGTMLSAKNVKLKLNVWALFSQRLELSGIAVDRPAVRLWRGRDGHANWEGLAGIGDTTAAPQRFREVSIPGIHLGNARLGYYGADGKLAFYFEDLDLDLNRSGKGWNFNLRVAKVGNPGPIPHLDQPILAKGSTGELKPGAPVTFKLSAECGDLSLSGQGSASPKRVDFTHGMVRRKGAPRALEDLRARYLSDARGSRIDYFDGRVGSSRFAGALVLEPPPLRGTFKGDLNLAELSEFLPQEQRGISGRANVAIQFIAQSADVRGAQIQGLADLTNVGLPARSADSQPLTGISGRVWFSRLSANTQDLQGRYGNLPFRLSGSVDEPLALVNAMDPAPLANARVAVAHFDLTTGPVDADRLFPPGKPIERAPLVIADGVIHTSRLQAKKLDVANVMAKFRYDRGLIHVDGATAEGYRGTMTATGDVDFRNPSKPVYSLNVKGTGLDAETAMHTWVPPLGSLLTGAFDVNLTTSGNGFGTKEALANLSLDALAKSADGRLAGATLLQRAAQWTGLADLNTIQFKNLLWHIIVKQGRVLFRDVTIQGLDGDYGVGGWIGLNGDLGLQVALAIPQTKLGNLSPSLRTASHFLTDKSGHVILNFDVGGTVHDPTFSLNTDKASQLLAQNLQAQLLGMALNPLQKALEDSLSKGKTIQDQVFNVANLQKVILEKNSQQQQSDVMNEAASWIQDLLQPKSKKALPDTTKTPAPPPPPPASDTTKVPPPPPTPDTTKKALPDTAKHP